MDIYVQKDGQPQGPFPEAKIREGIDTGEFAPDDLAWMRGRVSWQPLSVLLNLDTSNPPPLSEWISKESEHGANAPNFVLIPGPLDGEPSPIPNLDEHGKSPREKSDDLGTDSPRSNHSAIPDVVLANGESLLYTSDSVVVTTSRLVVNDHTVSLDGVTEAKLEVIYTKCDGYYGIALIFYWAMFWFCCILLVGLLFVGGIGLMMLILLPFFYYYAAKESRAAPWNHYNNAKITLMQAGRQFVCYSKACCIHPDLMKRDKLTSEQREKMKFDLLRALGTAKAICDAISVAIASKRSKS